MYIQYNWSAFCKFLSKNAVLNTVIGCDNTELNVLM